MRIALVSEGTYPYAMGGVSVWCDQLIRGMPGFRWDFLALTVDGSEQAIWELPSNLDQAFAVPVWHEGERPRGRRQASADLVEAVEDLLDALVQGLPKDEQSRGLQRELFQWALQRICLMAADGEGVDRQLASPRTLDALVSKWNGRHADPMSLDHAVNALWLLEHFLRPLVATAQRPVLRRADIVHASMNGLSILPALAAKWLHETPMVLSEHGIYLRERYLGYLADDTPAQVQALALTFFRLLCSVGYVVADAITPHSAYNSRWPLHNGADAKKIVTQYNGVELDDFPVATTDPDRPTISFLGRIDPLKDLLTLVTAFGIVHEQLPSARLKIYGVAPVGNEQYRDAVVARVAQLKLESAVTFCGRVERQADAYHAGHVVALSSISEGFPYTVVEAMACGRPVVATNVGGVSEAVADAGFVVSARDSEAFAAACIRLLEDAALRKRMGARARERVEERFTLGRSIDEYAMVYESLLDPGSRPAALPMVPEQAKVSKAKPQPAVAR